MVVVVHLPIVLQCDGINTGWVCIARRSRVTPRGPLRRGIPSSSNRRRLSLAGYTSPTTKYGYGLDFAYDQRGETRWLPYVRCIKNNVPSIPPGRSLDGYMVFNISSATSLSLAFRFLSNVDAPSVCSFISLLIICTAADDVAETADAADG